MQRVFVAEIPVPEDDEVEPHPQSGRTFILINPKVVKTSNDLVEGEEGCLSMPGWAGLVNRPTWVEVRAQDVSGRKVKLKVDDHLARIFMHEIDHLDGVLYVDHITDKDKLWEITADEDADREGEETQVAA
jgi:peptide deformylase